MARGQESLTTVKHDGGACVCNHLGSGRNTPTVVTSQADYRPPVDKAARPETWWLLAMDLHGETAE